MTGWCDIEIRTNYTSEVLRYFSKFYESIVFKFYETILELLSCTTCWNLFPCTSASSASIFAGEEGFDKFTEDMVKQFMKEEEVRAQHQVHAVFYFTLFHSYSPFLVAIVFFLKMNKHCCNNYTSLLVFFPHTFCYLL